jgi:hypothetical protein
MMKDDGIDCCCHFFFVDMMIFFWGPTEVIRLFHSLVILNSRKAKDLYKGLDVVLHLYNGRGFFISRILCDGEFEPLM